MGLFDKKNAVKILEEDLKDAQLSTVGFKHETQRKRAYTNVLAARLAIKMLFTKKIQANNLYSLYTAHKILEDLDIADIYVGKIKIDVRLVFNKENIFIPKSHFKFDMLPDVYAVLTLNEDMSSVEFLGYFEPKNLDKNNQNKDFYFIEQENLQPQDSFKKFLENFSKSDADIANEADIEQAEIMLLSYIDDEIKDSEKGFLLKQLANSIELREKFVEFENFEIISKEAAKHEELFHDNVLDIIGAQQVFEEEQQSKEEYKSEVIGEVLEGILTDDTEEDLNIFDSIETQEETEKQIYTQEDLEELFAQNENESTPENEEEEVQAEEEEINLFEASFDEAEVKKEEKSDDSLLQAGVKTLGAGLELGAAIAAASGAAVAASAATAAAAAQAGASVEQEIIKGVASIAQEAIETGQDLLTSQPDFSDSIDINSDDELDFADFNFDDEITSSISTNEDEEISLDIPDELESEIEDLLEGFNEESIELDSELEAEPDTDLEIEPQAAEPESTEPEPVQAIEAAFSDELPEIDFSDIEPLEEIGQIEEINPTEELAETEETISQDEIVEQITENFEEKTATAEEETTTETEEENEEEEEEIQPAASTKKKEPEFIFESDFEAQALNTDSSPEYHAETTENAVIEDDNEFEKIKSQLNIEETEEDSFELDESQLEKLGINLKTENVEPQYITDEEIQEEAVIEEKDDNLVSFDEILPTLSIEQELPEEDKKSSNLDEHEIEAKIRELEKLEEIENSEEVESSNSNVEPVLAEEDDFISQVDDFLKDIDLSDEQKELLEKSLGIQENPQELDEGFFEDITAYNPENSAYTTSSTDDFNISEENFEQSETDEYQTEEIFAAATNDVAEKDPLQMLFEKEKSEIGDIQDIDFSKSKYESSLKNKKMVIAASLAGLILVSTVVGVSVKNNNASDTLAQNQGINAPISADGEQSAIPQDINSLVPTSADSAGVQTQEASQEQVAQNALGANSQPAVDMSKAVSDAFMAEPVNATISKVAWEVPEDLAYNDSFRKYLQTAGKNLKLNLQNDLLLTNDMAYSSKIIVDLTLSKNGGLGASNIVVSSGSKQIDNIVLQNVKETLKYLKMPSAELSSPSTSATLIINF